MKNAQGFLVFYDITNKASFEKIPEIVEKVRHNNPKYIAGLNFQVGDLCMVIAVNKKQ